MEAMPAVPRVVGLSKMRAEFPQGWNPLETMRFSFLFLSFLTPNLDLSKGYDA
jgi:hypothetical protein